MTLKKKVAVAWRPGPVMAVETAARRSLATVARRWRSVDDEACELSRHIKVILDEVAGQLLVTPGDNPERLHNEKSPAGAVRLFSVRASSGRANRHRLNRGDRNANSALWTRLLVRMGSHPPTHAYVERRTAEGLSKPDIMAA